MKCQRETDGRKLSSKEKESLCLRVVRRIEAGIHPEDLAQDLDINLRTVYRWLEKYHYGGEDALKAEPRPGREPKLNALQMRQLARMIRDRSPLQLHSTFALWNRAMVRELIRREFGVRLSETSVGRLLRVTLPGGTAEVLATDLFDQNAFPAHLFKGLYAVSVLPNTSFRRLVASPIMMAGPFGEERHHGLAAAQSERVAAVGGRLAA